MLFLKLSHCPFWKCIHCTPSSSHRRAMLWPHWLGFLSESSWPDSCYHLHSSLIVRWEMSTVPVPVRTSEHGQSTASAGHYQHIVRGTLHLLVLDRQVCKTMLQMVILYTNELSEIHPCFRKVINYSWRVLYSYWTAHITNRLFIICHMETKHRNHFSKSLRAFCSCFTLNTGSYL